MPLFSWLHKRTGRPQTRRAPARQPIRASRPQLEALEARDLPSFAAPVSYTGSAPAVPVLTADVNNDGKLDILTLQRNSGSGYVFLNKSNGTFATPRQFFDLNEPTTMAVGDVNGDGKLDIALANWGVSGWGVASSLTVLLGNGDGTFTSVLPNSLTQDIFPFKDRITSLALADVNGDGKLDLLATSVNGRLYVASSRGNGSFATAQTYFLNAGYVAGSLQLAVGDFNADGKPDVAVTVPNQGLIGVLLNSGNGTFGTAQTWSVGASPTAVAVGDVNGDGQLDIITANANGTVSVLGGQGNGTFATAQNYAISGPANSVALGDFNQDGHLDIATTGGTEMDVLLNNGSGSFATYQKVGPAGSGVVAADFNSDGYPDLAQIDASTGHLEVLLNKANWGK
jgi:hypothetical protein